MKKLQAQADTLIAKKAQAAVDQIRQIMLKHGLTTKDIEAKAKAKREAKTAVGRASNGKAHAAVIAKGKLPAKYRDPKTGAVWSGHARPPSWIANVKDRTKFLIDGAGVAANAGTPKKAQAAVKKAVGTKKAAAGKVVTKKAAFAKSGSPKAAASARKVAAKKSTAVSKKAATPAAKKTRGRKAAATKTAAARPDSASEAISA
jgi:DNA-binding protein H-NS